MQGKAMRHLCWKQSSREGKQLCSAHKLLSFIGNRFPGYCSTWLSCVFFLFQAQKLVLSVLLFSVSLTVCFYWLIIALRKMQCCHKNHLGTTSSVPSQHIPCTFTLSSCEFLTLWVLYNSPNAYCFSCYYDPCELFGITPSSDFSLVFKEQ